MQENQTLSASDCIVIQDVNTAYIQKRLGLSKFHVSLQFQNCAFFIFLESYKVSTPTKSYGCIAFEIAFQSRS